MKLLILLIVTLVSLSSFTLSVDFDVLVIVWPTSFCEGSKKCLEEKPNIFTLHGLWTNRFTKVCSTVTPDLNTFRSWPIFADLNQYWLKLDAENIIIWQHEWEKHGTCIADPLA
ncbi:putative ribonuclease T(2) [Lupinus albus]|uniref:Putative ribonuclease T(2) n=1 Tax=Lupinus albus TaxID=3870 RepID=A0A6A4NSD3_LUPAL|nr:putative ribonuclease T(2) [Lupinus albus]